MFDNVMFFTAEVVNIKDPDKAGRVQIRVHGYHDDKSKIPRANLPWAQPVTPITSAAHNKIGVIPHGVVVGSTVMGFWTDGNSKQQPVYIGTINRSGEKKSQGSGADKLPEDTNSTPAQGRVKSNKNNTQAGKNPVTENKERDADKETPRSDSDAKDLVKETVSKFSEAAIGTIASVAAGADVLSLIKQVDPQGKGLAHPKAPDAFKAIINASGMSGMGGISGILQGGLTGALSSMASKLGAGNVLGQMLGVLQSPAGQLAMNALADETKMAIYTSLGDVANIHKEGNLSQYVIDPNEKRLETPNSNVPADKIKKEEEIPEGWEEVLLLDSEDIYYPYVKWENPENPEQYLFSLRPVGDSASDPTAIIKRQVQIDLENKMYKLLQSPQVVDPVVMIGILSGGLDLAKNLGIAKLLGKGLGMGSMIGAAASLIPQVGGLVQGLTNIQLPDSVLDAGSITDALKDFTKDVGIMLKKKEKEAEKIFAGADIGGALGSLAAAASVAGIGGRLSLNIGGFNASVNLRNLSVGASVNVPGIGSVGVGI